MSTTMIIIAPDDFDPATIETLELLELAYRGELWPDNPMRRQLLDELQQTGLIKHNPGINEPNHQTWSGERYSLTDDGTRKARELQRLYRKMTISVPHFNLLSNLDCTLGAASTTLVGGYHEPTSTSGIIFGAPNTRLFAKHLPSVILSSTPEGLYLVTNSISTIWDIRCKTVGDELLLSAEFPHNHSRSAQWGHHSLGYTLRIVPPATRNDHSPEDAR